jgi:hypothetical protein
LFGEDSVFNGLGVGCVGIGFFAQVRRLWYRCIRRLCLGLFRGRPEVVERR